MKVSKTLLIPLLAAIAVSLIAFAAEYYIGPLLNMSYTIVSHPAYISQGYVNLGTLSPGQNGSASSSATLTVYRAGVFTIGFSNITALSQFYVFNVIITFSNSSQTVRIYLSYPSGSYSDQVYLAPGTYYLNIIATYYVSPTATNSTYSGPVLGVWYSSS